MLSAIHRRASLVLAGISCIGIPIGTILGGLTLDALTRPELSSEFTPTTDYGQPTGASILLVP